MKSSKKRKKQATTQQQQTTNIHNQEIKNRKRGINNIICSHEEIRQKTDIKKST